MLVAGPAKKRAFPRSAVVENRDSIRLRRNVLVIDTGH